MEWKQTSSAVFYSVSTAAWFPEAVGIAEILNKEK